MWRRVREFDSTKGWRFLMASRPNFFRPFLNIVALGALVGSLVFLPVSSITGIILLAVASLFFLGQAYLDSTFIGSKNLAGSKQIELSRLTDESKKLEPSQKYAISLIVLSALVAVGGTIALFVFAPFTLAVAIGMPIIIAASLALRFLAAVTMTRGVVNAQNTTTDTAKSLEKNTLRRSLEFIFAGFLKLDKEKSDNVFEPSTRFFRSFSATLPIVAIPLLIAVPILATKTTLLNFFLFGLGAATAPGVAAVIACVIGSFVVLSALVGGVLLYNNYLSPGQTQNDAGASRNVAPNREAPQFNAGIIGKEKEAGMTYLLQGAREGGNPATLPNGNIPVQPGGLGIGGILNGLGAAKGGEIPDNNIPDELEATRGTPEDEAQVVSHEENSVSAQQGRLVVADEQQEEEVNGGGEDFIPVEPGVPPLQS